MLHFEFKYHNISQFMTVHDHIVNSRSLTAYSSLDNELTCSDHQNYLFNLSSAYGLLAIQGDRADEFLQGQVSCDVHEVTQAQIRQGAFCNIKGRVLALTDIIRWHELLYLIMPKDMLAGMEKMLAKTAVFSKVQIHSVNTFDIYGLYHPKKDVNMPVPLQFACEKLKATSNDTYLSYSLAPNLTILLAPVNERNQLEEYFLQQGQLRGSLAWHLLRLKHGLFEIYPETRGLFLPHRLDLHKSGYLSFNKGCYKGQEIIARMHYRSKPKHTLKLLWLTAEEMPQSGKKLFTTDGSQEIGELVDFCPAGANRYLAAASMLFEHPMESLLEGHSAPITLEPCND